LLNFKGNTPTLALVRKKKQLRRRPNEINGFENDYITAKVIKYLKVVLNKMSEIKKIISYSFTHLINIIIKCKY